MSPWKVILATMVIFGCGVVTGGLLMENGLRIRFAPAPAAQTRPRQASSATNQAPPLVQFQRPEFLRRMQKQLDLTPEQCDAITKIMHDSQERTRPVWELIQPRLREEMKRDRQEIRAVLDPDQQRRFDEMLRPRRKAVLGPGEQTNQL